ncbi:MAG: Panacea domain-containing protein [Cyclobacteriaceae bacterium]
MTKFKFDIDKSINALLYIIKALNKSKTNCDIHKISKILYFAEQQHLVKYGRPIIGDTYIAMKYGPVPSNVYEIVKFVRGDSAFILTSDDEVKFKLKAVNDYSIEALQEPDLDYFSETDLECLQNSIEANKNLTFDQLTDKSHGLAYEKVECNLAIAIEDIALEGGASEDMIEYMKVVAENLYD